MAYNTTPFHGKVCRIEKNNVAISDSLEWSVDASVDMADKTGQGDNWASALPGIAKATGSMKYKLVLGNTEQKALVDNIISATPGTKLTDVKFLLDASTNAFTGDIFITGFSVAASVSGGVVTGSFNFQFDGALEMTNAA